ncbi:titin [Anabrus simplex]|uniref:titin n=1 Tax=Anabrus simplex TaxID=316456 RepID=UPI0035A33228
MKARGRSEEPGRQTRGTSRDSSVSSSGREVRCACQYFQSDSLLPERVPFAGRPPSRTSQMATQIGDHEYEPISPPADPQQPPQPRLAMDIDVEMELGVASKKREGSQASSTDSRERRFLRIPLDDELVVPGDGEAEDAAMGGREMGDTMNGNGHEDVDGDADADAERELSAQELQAQMEERYFANTPTTESRTDCDVNTSQLDSSGLEDLPLKRDARKKKQDVASDKQTEARGLQQKIRSQAGRIRTKLRNMSRPKFSMPERPKFNLPERPKFSMPERPKFNLPERPKFNLPERPKFNLPERPKFNMPERPKFTMPERPKFNLPQRPKLTMKSLSLSKSSPKKPTSSTRRPLRDRPSTISTASSKKNLFDFDFKSYPRIFDRKSRANADYATSSPKQTRAQTPPPKMPSRKKGPVGQRWLHRFTDIKYADENMPELGDDEDEAMGARGGIGRDIQDRMDISNDERYNIDNREGGERPESTHTESTSAFRDKDYGYAITMVDNTQALQEKSDQPSNSIPESDREQRSSGSSSDRHRAGVLEEIDSDEFFLREKGLSQEDVDVGRYLTSEIRDAFRSPVSALSQMDKYDYYDDEEDMENLGQQYRGTPEREPTRPARTRSLRPRKREGKSKTPSPPVEEDSSQFFNTFPPTRPKRVRRQPEHIQNEDEQTQPDQPQEGIEVEAGVEDEEIDATAEKEEKIHDVGSLNEEVPAINEENLEQEIGTTGLEKPASDVQRISPTIKVSVPEEEFIQNVIEYQEEDFPEQSEENWNAEDELTSASNAPLVPKRKRRSRRDLLQDLPQEPICNGSYTKEDWLENIESRIVDDEIAALRMEPDYIIPASPDEEYFEEAPVPPKRGRRKGSRGTSLIDEDRTSRGAESLPSERDVVADDVACDISLNDMGGYASVEKPSKPEPAKRRPKPPRPPPPGRRKRSVGQIRVTTNDISHFFSLPRKAIRAPPVRPVRNYSTLGPSRPPRRERVIEHEYTEQEEKSEAYMEIEDTDLSLRQEESHGSTRDLQSGDVIEKMKGRPLPPPPRPPRKGREGKDSQEVEESSEGLKDLSGGEGNLKVEAYTEEPMAALIDSVFYSKQEAVSAYDQYQDKVSAEFEEERAVSPSHLMTETDVEPEEVSVATQTDPLPDDFCVEAGDIDDQQEPPVLADASTETTASSMFKSSVNIQTDTRTEPSEEKVTATPVQRVEVSQFQSFKREEKPPPEVPTRPPEPVIIERPVPYYVMPDPDTEVELKAQRLQVSELDVERLNVGELQAQKIMVSDIDGMSMQVAELSSKSGHLVVSGIELPSGFLQELVDSRSKPPSVVTPELTQVSSPSTVISPQSPTATPETVISSSAPPTEISEQVPSTPKQSDTPVIQAETISSPLASSVPPQSTSAARSRSHVHNIQSVPPESIHSYIPEFSPNSSTVRGSSRSRAHVSAIQRDFGSEEEMLNLIPTPSSRRRRHYSRPPVLRDSSDEDEEEDLASFHPPTRRHQSRAGEPSVGELGRQMVQACQAATMRAIRHTLQYANSHLHEGDDKRRDLQIALCLLLALVAALILMGFGRGKTFHYHHWDYLFPPTR